MCWIRYIFRCRLCDTKTLGIGIGTKRGMSWKELRMNRILTYKLTDSTYYIMENMKEKNSKE